ncbi:MAG TPA: thymidine phosphorylase, partial [Ignavibacteria bacterium]|nr:thymidine phosphorylase [Ignavibacteria bacterium]
IDGLILDVKTGSGAFMKKISDAENLANSLINTAKAFNKNVIAFITDMNQPLGNFIGNWLEVYESIKVLQGEATGDLRELSLALSGAMIYLGKKASSIEEGIEISSELIKNGQAFEKFVEIVKMQKGNVNVILHPDKYPKSKVIEKIYFKNGGFVKKIDNYTVGICALELGAGRKTKEDKIDPKAGIIFKVKIGDYVKKGDLIAELHSSSKTKVDIVKKMLYNTIILTSEKVNKQKLIKKIIYDNRN